MLGSWITIGVLFIMTTTSLAVKPATFQFHDKIELQAAKASPFNNPSETYSYYSLPFCPPKNFNRKKHSIGEYLAGDRRYATQYDIRYLVNYEWRELCVKELSDGEVDRLRLAVQEDYFFEFVLDGLPAWSFVGEHEDDSGLIGDATGQSRDYVYSHLHFSIAYNDDKVIAINITAPPEKRVQLARSDESTGAFPHGRRTPLSIEFSYSVEWVPTTERWHGRMERYHDSSFLPGSAQVHWYSITNSVVLVVLLVAFLIMVLARVVRSDFAAALRDEDGDTADENGWKLVRTNVFRTPGGHSCLAGMVGAGIHLFCMTVLLLVLAVTNTFHVTRRGAIVVAAIVLYCVTAPVGGFIASRLYAQLTARGTGYKRTGGAAGASAGATAVRDAAQRGAGGAEEGGSRTTAALVSLLVFPAALLSVFSVINTAAISKGSSVALPAATIAAFVGLFAVLALPAGLMGAWCGRSSGSDYTPPCRVSTTMRTLPDTPWYQGATVHLLGAGLLPFSAISVQLHYIFIAIWGHMVYTMFGILLLAFGLLTLVVGFVCVALAYLQLSRQDYLWHWRAYTSGGMVGAFIYAYAFVYYFQHSGMSGLLQGLVYFGYMGVMSFGFSVMFGAVGFLATFWFVDFIYGQIKGD